MRSLRFSVVSVVVGLLACGGGSSQPATLSSNWAAPPILANVPAETPYLFASLDQVSETTRLRMLHGFDKQLAELWRLVDSVQGTDRSTLEPWMRAGLSLADELRRKPITTWWKDLGFAPDGRFVVYGLSVWPVVRAELANPARLRTVIENALSAAGVQSKQGSLGGKNYWSASTSDLTFIAAVLDREAVVAVLPSRAVQSALPFVLGIQKPERNLASTTTMRDLLGRHHLLGYLLAYLDARNAVDIVTSQRPSELDAPLHALTGPIDPACRSDLDRLVGIAPRLVFGYRKLDDAGFDGTIVLETSPSVTSALNKLHASVPELTTSSRERPLVAFGAAINPEALVAWLRGVAQQLRDRPFTCPWFAALNEAGAKVAQQLTAPLPAMLKSVRGFSVVIDAATLAPLNIDGHLIIAGERIADAISSFAATMPWLAGIPLKRDGPPVAIPTQQFGLPIPSAHVAMTSDRVVIASGSASAQRVTNHLASPTPKSSPLFMMAFDAPRLQMLLKSLGRSDIDIDTLGYLGNVGMSFDVIGDGIGFDVWGSWADAPAIAQPAAP